MKLFRSASHVRGNACFGNLSHAINIQITKAAQLLTV